MNDSMNFLMLTIVSLAAIFILVYLRFKNNTEKPITFMTGIAVGFVVAGIFAGEGRLAGYGLMGIGVLIALLDVWKKRSKPSQPQ
jgi:hypothetical protein